MLLQYFHRPGREASKLTIFQLKKLYYKSIGGITEGSTTLFTTHNSARKLIVNHIAFLNAEVHCITSQIASLRKHKMTGYIMVDKIW
jgi:hypothetical protein